MVSVLHLWVGIVSLSSSLWSSTRLSAWSHSVLAIYGPSWWHCELSSLVLVFIFRRTILLRSNRFRQCAHHIFDKGKVKIQPSEQKIIKLRKAHLAEYCNLLFCHIHVRDDLIAPCCCVRIFGVLFDGTLALNQQVTATCTFSFYHDLD